MILPVMAFAAAPRGQAALAAEDPKEAPSERQVRASPEVKENSAARKANKVVSMAVEPDGHISGGASAATPMTIRTMEKQEEKKKEEAKVDVVKKEDKKVVQAKPHGVVAAQAPTDEPAQPQSQQAPKQDAQPAAKGGKSWKSAFFFFASLVLMVVLAGAIAARLYASKKESEQASSSGERATLKAQEAQTGAAALQQHLNDSSSTSDSGEKIAMLFDRVRKSLEDLGDQAPDAADVAGTGRGGQQTNTL